MESGNSPKGQKIIARAAGRSIAQYEWNKNKMFGARTGSDEYKHRVNEMGRNSRNAHRAESRLGIHTGITDMFDTAKEHPVIKKEYNKTKKQILRNQ